MAGIEYPPYRPPDDRSRPHKEATLHGREHLPHARAVAARAAALTLYVTAAVVVAVLLAPLMPGGSTSPGPYATRIPTRTVEARSRDSVQSLALRVHATPFELYALNRRLKGPFIEPGARVRVPAR